MNFKEHSDLIGQHAFLSPSKYHWINYDDNKLEGAFTRAQAVRIGVELHEFAFHAIRLGIKLPRSPKTLNMYINDAIGFGLTPEQPLYYSENCFGTADAIGFKRKTLRVHDLKTGVIAGSIHQLEIYAALFCLEYDVNPNDITILLRIYQNDDFYEEESLPENIFYIMEKIVTFDKMIEKIKIDM